MAEKHQRRRGIERLHSMARNGVVGADDRISRLRESVSIPDTPEAIMRIERVYLDVRVDPECPGFVVLEMRLPVCPLTDLAPGRRTGIDAALEISAFCVRGACVEQTSDGGQSPEDEKSDKIGEA
jgi:hypothetical protein